MSSEPLSARELFALEVDVRIAALWVEVPDEFAGQAKVLGSAMRAAYAIGYRDALLELGADPLENELCRLWRESRERSSS